MIDWTNALHRSTWTCTKHNHLWSECSKQLSEHPLGALGKGCSCRCSPLYRLDMYGANCCLCILLSIEGFICSLLRGLDLCRRIGIGSGFLLLIRIWTLMSPSPLRILGWILARIVGYAGWICSYVLVVQLWAAKIFELFGLRFDLGRCLFCLCWASHSKCLLNSQSSLCWPSSWNWIFQILCY